MTAKKTRQKTNIQWHRLACDLAKAYSPHAAARFQLPHNALDVLPMAVEGGSLVRAVVDETSATLTFSDPRTRLSAVLYTVSSG